MKLINSLIVSLFVSSSIIALSLLNIIGNVVILLFPIAPIIYGWISRDKIGSIIVGTVPVVVSFLYGTGGLYDHHDGVISIAIHFIERNYLIGLMAFVGGLEGYYASQGKKDELKFAILLGVAWTLLFIRGIN